MAVVQLLAVDRAELVLQRGGGGEAVGDRVGVGERVDFDRLDRSDADRPDAGDVAPLAGAHHAELPQADRLRFFAAADGVEEFFLEEEHGLSPRNGGRWRAQCVPVRPHFAPAERAAPSTQLPLQATLARHIIRNARKGRRTAELGGSRGGRRFRRQRFCCGCSSVGRARRCQRCCRRFESDHPLL